MFDTQSPKLEVFQQLDIHYPPGSQLRDALRTQAKPPWHHSCEAEDNIKQNGNDSLDLIVFNRDEGFGIRASLLVLCVDSGICKLANIVPDRISSLEECGYNDILDDFMERVVKPAAETTGIHWDITKRKQTITDWTSREAAEALHTFSCAANKSTGSSHPADAEQWRKFLIENHRAASKMNESQFRWWLVEVEDWPLSVADRLVSAREDAREILRDYDQFV